MKRTCASPDCDTILSRYSGSDRCSLHGGGPRPYDFFVSESHRSVRAGLLEPWRDEAACRDRDTEMFDVDLPSDGAMTGPVLAAKRICAACPVRPECLSYAFRMAGHVFSVTGDPKVTPKETKYHDTIYGGLTGRERMRLHDEPDRVQCGITLLDTQRLLWWLDPLNREEEAA